jgi:hypothetical protein
MQSYTLIRQTVYVVLCIVSLIRVHARISIVTIFVCFFAQFR